MGHDLDYPGHHSPWRTHSEYPPIHCICLERYWGFYRPFSLGQTVSFFLVLVELFALFQHVWAYFYLYSFFEETV